MRRCVRPSTKPFTAGTPATQRRHVGLDTGLVDNSEATGINPMLRPFPPARRRGANSQTCRCTNLQLHHSVHWCPATTLCLPQKNVRGPGLGTTSFEL